MNGNSLSEQTLAKTTEIAELLHSLKFEDTEINKATFMRIAVLNGQLMQLAHRRLTRTVKEGMRRTDALIALGTTANIPQQRG